MYHSEIISEDVGVSLSVPKRLNKLKIKCNDAQYH